jgi:hypothetical protein
VNRTDVTQLTDLFRRLGARDPQDWAGSEVAEGLPQLERFLFLRQAVAISGCGGTFSC